MLALLLMSLSMCNQQRLLDAFDSNHFVCFRRFCGPISLFKVKTVLKIYQDSITCLHSERTLLTLPVPTASLQKGAHLVATLLTQSGTSQSSTVGEFTPWKMISNNNQDSVHFVDCHCRLKKNVETVNVDMLKYVRL